MARSLPSNGFSLCAPLGLIDNTRIILGGPTFFLTGGVSTERGKRGVFSHTGVSSLQKRAKGGSSQQKKIAPGGSKKKNPPGR